MITNGQPWRGSASQPPPTIDNPTPKLFGQVFDGPMAGHSPTGPWHWDLHVWLWEYNPLGLFVPLNPAVSCP